MGNSNSEPASLLIKLCQKADLTDEQMKVIFQPFLEMWLNEDWDTYDEIVGMDPLVDEALVKALNKVCRTKSHKLIETKHGKRIIDTEYESESDYE